MHVFCIVTCDRIKYFISVCCHCVCDKLIAVCHRLRKVWQKRKCTAKNGYLTISHGTVSKQQHPNARRDLLKQIHAPNRPPCRLHLVLTHITVSVSWLQAFSPAGHYLHPLTMNTLTDSSPSSQVNIRLTSLPRLSLSKLSVPI